MNYELAKKLKDAGYKTTSDFQEYSRMYCPHPHEGVEGIGHIAHCPQAIYVPHLEELIEACGDQFDGLIMNRGPLAEINSLWSAAGNGEIGLGTDPQIAVAKLWLALHTPSK